MNVFPKMVLETPKNRKKGDVAGDISPRMPIELCSPQDKFLLRAKTEPLIESE
jgi:hypothetical protein